MVLDEQRTSPKYIYAATKASERLRLAHTRASGSQHGSAAAQNDATSDSARRPYWPPPSDARLPASLPPPPYCSTHPTIQPRASPAYSFRREYANIPPTI